MGSRAFISGKIGFYGSEGKARRSIALTSKSGGRLQAKEECGVVTRAAAPFKKGSVFYEGSQSVFL